MLAQRRLFECNHAGKSEDMIEFALDFWKDPLHCLSDVLSSARPHWISGQVLSSHSIVSFSRQSGHALGFAQKTVYFCILLNQQQVKLADIFMPLL